MPTYTDADKATVALAEEMLLKHHPELEAVDLTVKYLMAYAKEGKEALKHHGYPALAIIKINSYEARMTGTPDVTLKIDGAWWKEATDKQKRALLRHEFLHLVLQKDPETGAPMTDDADRPRLKLRLHDVQLGTFDDVVKEFREDAADTKMLREAFERPVIQGLFQWG